MLHIEVQLPFLVLLALSRRCGLCLVIWRPYPNVSSRIAGVERERVPCVGVCSLYCLNVTNGWKGRNVIPEQNTGMT
jgi:hypothetical protein